MSRMALSNVVRGRINQPLRILVMGQEGVGKSTFGAGAPKPIFLAAEDGTSQLDVARFPMPQNWTEALDAIGLLSREAHEYQTLVVDTLDWLEALCHAHVCRAQGKADIEAFGYGKGYVLALDQWRLFLSALERLRAVRPMTIVLLAHTHRRPFSNPEGEDYERFEMKLHKGSSALLREWSDIVGFASYEVVTVKEGQAARAKAVTTGNRLLRTGWSASFDAKDRFGIPSQLPLAWSALASALSERMQPSAVALVAEVEALLKANPTWEHHASASQALDEHRENVSALKQLRDKIKSAVTAPANNGA